MSKKVILALGVNEVVFGLEVHKNDIWFCLDIWYRLRLIFYLLRSKDFLLNVGDYLLYFLILVKPLLSSFLIYSSLLDFGFFFVVAFSFEPKMPSFILQLLHICCEIWFVPYVAKIFSKFVCVTAEKNVEYVSCRENTKHAFSGYKRFVRCVLREEILVDDRVEQNARSYPQQ